MICRWIMTLFKNDPINVRPHKIIAIVVVVILVATVLVFLVHHLTYSSGPKEYETLTEIEKYAHRLEEYVEPQNKNWNNPKFDKFFASRGPTVFGSLLQALGVYGSSPWSIHYLGTLIREETKNQHEKGIRDGRNAVVLIKAHKPLSLFVFGDLHGAFHSLVRNLRYLHSQKLLGDDLRLLNDSTFLVFNGDVVSRSAYSMDTLILVAQLMRQNPSKVIYVAGTHERDIVWKNYSLADELRLRAGERGTQDIPLSVELTQFFDALPSAVYVTGKDDKEEVVRIAHSGFDELTFSEQVITPDRFPKDALVKIHQVATKDRNPPTSIDVRAAIKTANWRHGNRIERGVGLLDPDNGATTWAVFSSPTYIHREFFNFYLDACMRISIHERVFESVASTISHDQRSKAGFVEHESVSIISGSTRPYKNNSINVGSSLSLVSGIPSTGYQLKAGMSSAVNAFNLHNEQGLHARIFVSNDNYSPRLARQNTSLHLQRGVRSFLLSLGTPTLAAYLDLLKQNHAVVFFPQTGSSLIRAPQFTNLVHFLSSYEDEARALVQEIKKEYGARKFAFFYQADAFGNGPFEAAVEELKKLGITDILPLPYTRGTMLFSGMAEEIIRSGVDAIGFFSVGTSTKEFVRQVGVSVLQSLALFGLSTVGEIPLRRVFHEKGLRVLYGSAVPNPQISKLPIAKEYREAMKRDDNLVDVFSFEAYIATQLFLYAYKNTNRVEPTPFEILSEVESMKDVDFKGLKFNFNPKTRSLATEVYIETGENEVWKRYPIQGN